MKCSYRATHITPAALPGRYRRQSGQHRVTSPEGGMLARVVAIPRAQRGRWRRRLALGVELEGKFMLLVVRKSSRKIFVFCWIFLLSRVNCDLFCVFIEDGWKWLVDLMLTFVTIAIHWINTLMQINEKQYTAFCPIFFYKHSQLKTNMNTEKKKTGRKRQV